MNIDDEINSKKFKDAFWIWWDALPESERRLFDFHKDDWAYVNFYNRIYRRMKNDGQDCATGRDTLPD